MRRCLLLCRCISLPLLPQPLPLPLACCCVCAQLVCICICCKYEYSQNYYTWHDWIYRWVHTIPERGTSRELRRDRIRTQSKPIPMSSQSERPLPSKRPSACLTAAAAAIALAIAGHSFLRSQWAIPVSALVCSTLTCRINVSGHNVVFVVRYFQQVQKFNKCSIFVVTLRSCFDIDKWRFSWL